MDVNSYLILVEVPAMGPMEDLVQALQAAYTEGNTAGHFEVRPTHEPGYMVLFLRSVADDDDSYLRNRIGEGCETFHLAAMHQLAEELREAARDLAMPVIEVLSNGDAQIVDFNGVLNG